MKDTIRRVVADYGKLRTPISKLSDSDDLFDAGLTSLNIVNIMLALENEFDVEFPESMLTRSTFQSIDAQAAAITELGTKTT